MAFSCWEAGRLAGSLSAKLAGRLGGGEDRFRKFSHLKSDDSMMLVIMIGWQFLAGRLGGWLEVGRGEEIKNLQPPKK